MKKIIKFISIALIVLISFSAIGGCAEKDDNTDTKVSSGNITVINDFSSYKSLYQILLKDYFGKVELNLDTEFILTGTGSAKVMPGQNIRSAPYFKQRLLSEVFETDNTNFSKAKRIATQIYNNEKYEVNVYCGLEFQDGNRTTKEKFTLSPESWTSVDYNIFPELLGLRYDTGKTGFIVYYFDAVDNEDAPVLYFDNITLIRTKNAPAPIEIKLEENEFCSFDKNYQEFIPYFFTWETGGTDHITQWGLNSQTKISGSSYMVTTVKGSVRWRIWYYMYFSETLVKASGFRELKDEDIFEFSIYNSGPTDNIAVQFRAENGASASLRLDIASNSWTNFRATIGEINSNASASMDGKSLTSSIKNISIAWGEFINTESKTFYFDEFKFIKSN